MSNNIRVQAEHCANPALFDRYEFKLVDDPHGRPFTTWAAEITDSRNNVTIIARLAETEYGASYGYEVPWDRKDALNEFFNVAKRAFPKVKRSVAPDYMCEYIIHTMKNECEHDGDWDHHYDDDSMLGDYYTCSQCGDLTQVG